MFAISPLVLLIVALTTGSTIAVNGEGEAAPATAEATATASELSNGPDREPFTDLAGPAAGEAPEFADLEIGKGERNHLRRTSGLYF